MAHEVGEHRRLVHPRTYGADDALGSQLVERRVAACEDVCPVVVGVVEVDDVQPIEAEALEALLERTADPIPAEVPDAPVGGRTT